MYLNYRWAWIPYYYPKIQIMIKVMGFLIKLCTADIFFLKPAKRDSNWIDGSIYKYYWGVPYLFVTAVLSELYTNTIQKSLHHNNWFRPIDKI